MFNYGGFKLFLTKIFFGTFLISISSFLIISLLTQDPNDPGIGRITSKREIINFFGFWGSISSSFFLIIFGRLSLIIFVFIFYAGIRFGLGLVSKNIFIKFFLVVFAAILFDVSLVLQEVKAIESGLLSKFIFDILVYYLPAVFNIFLYKIIISCLIITLCVFVVAYSFSIKTQLFKKILIKILNTNFLIILALIKKISATNTKKMFNKSNKLKTKSEPTILKKIGTSSFVYNKNKTHGESSKSENSYIFNLPDISFLNKSKTKNSQKKEVESLNKYNSSKLEKVLEEYGVVGKVVGFKSGPIVTLYEFVPNAGIKASKIISLSDDIARAMSSVSARISSQPGKTSLGIEIPNLKREDVMFGDLIEDSKFVEKNNCITLALGKDISGQVVFADLEKMPHLLIAGTTGSGKSVGINTIIMSILYRFKPDECKLILIDPKMLELSIYEAIPHLLTPVVTNPNKAVFALKWVVKEMENRYKLMSSLNVKNINSYNEKSKKILSTGKKLFKNVETGIDSETRKPILEKREIPLEKMPFIVVVIDEMADLMMVAGKEVENLVQRLAQMARASGIHLVTATQRPSVDVITGTIKANFPSRISYKVASKFDSRTIINDMGAEQLLGSGDMLFLENGANLKRLHGGFISELEIEKVVGAIKDQAVFDQKNEIAINERSENDSMQFSFDEGEVDVLYTKAVNIVVAQQKVSTSYIQRYLQIGYNRAARIVEKMEEEGVISEANNAGKRQVLKKN